MSRNSNLNFVLLFLRTIGHVRAASRWNEKFRFSNVPTFIYTYKWKKVNNIYLILIKQTKETEKETFHLILRASSEIEANPRIGSAVKSRMKVKKISFVIFSSSTEESVVIQPSLKSASKAHILALWSWCIGTLEGKYPYVFPW